VFDVHLTAARLLRREHHLVAEPLEQADDRLAGARVQCIVETGHKQGNAHVSQAHAPPTGGAGDMTPFNRSRTRRSFCQSRH